MLSVVYQDVCLSYQMMHIKLCVVASWWF